MPLRRGTRIVAGRLIAIDVSDHALSLARQLGATHIINPNHVDARQAVYDLLPHGPDLVVEAAGPIEAEVVIQP